MISLISEDAMQEMCQIAAGCPPGCFVEVGVYQGGSASRLMEVARKQDRKVYLYDTFSGIPFKDEIDSHQVGDFGDSDVNVIRDMFPNAVVVQGIFPDSVVEMPPIAFAHVDADQYRSVKDCCLELAPRMVPGGKILFDDFNCLDGATKAVREIFCNVKVTKHNKGLVELA